MKKSIYLLIAALSITTSLTAHADFIDGTNLYSNGDYNGAYNEFLPEANNGDYLSEYYLGKMYFEGTGITKDYTQSLTWYEKAAEQNDSISQMQTALMYKYGLGTNKNYIQAYKWFKIVSLNGDLTALNHLKFITKYMSNTNIQEAELLVESWEQQQQKITSN